jgi:hypothetical protein
VLDPTILRLFLLIGLHKQLSKLSQDYQPILHVSSDIFFNHLYQLQVILVSSGSDVSMFDHISALYKSSFCHIYDVDC